jgi:hypothetical protein
MDRRSISCSASDRRCPPHRSDEHGLCFRRPPSKAYLLTRSNCFCIDDRLCGRKQCEAVQGSFSQSPSMTQTLPESIRLAFGSEDSSWGHEFGSRSVVETLNEFRPGSKGQRSWDREFPKLNLLAPGENDCDFSERGIQSRSSESQGGQVCECRLHGQVFRFVLSLSASTISNHPE